jgi:hypothetical protein
MQCTVYEANTTSQSAFLTSWRPHLHMFSAMANLNELAACVVPKGSSFVCSGFYALFSGNLTVSSADNGPAFTPPPWPK